LANELAEDHPIIVDRAVHPNTVQDSRMLALRFPQIVLNAAVGFSTIEVTDHRDISGVGLVRGVILLEHVNKVMVATTSARKSFQQESWKEMLAACFPIHWISLALQPAHWNS
jgi:hypothetical protein